MRSFLLFACSIFFSVLLGQSEDVKAQLYTSMQWQFDNSYNLKFGYHQSAYDMYTTESGVRTAAGFGGYYFTCKNLNSPNRTYGLGLSGIVRPFEKPFLPYFGMSFDYNTNFKAISAFDWEFIGGVGRKRFYVTYSRLYKRFVGRPNKGYNLIGAHLLLF